MLAHMELRAASPSVEVNHTTRRALTQITRMRLAAAAPAAIGSRGRDISWKTPGRRYPLALGAVSESVILQGKI